MVWREEPPEHGGLGAGQAAEPGGERLSPEGGEPHAFPSELGESPEGEGSGDLLSEVNRVAAHLRELQRRLGTYNRPDDEELAPRREPPPLPPPEPPPPPAPRVPPANGLGRQAEDAGEHVAAIISAAEAAAAEIRARAEASAAEIVANAESAAARIRQEASTEEKRLFEAIDALRPAAAEFQHALERVHDAAVAALMTYPRG